MTPTTDGSDGLGQVAGELHADVVAFAAEHGLPGVAVGIVHDQELIWTATVGHADVASGRPVTTDTAFQIASITKTFTATAILQLRDEGRLHLDDPLVRHIGELAGVTNPFGAIEHVTIERLLRHASGLQGEVPNRDPREWTHREQDDLVAHLHEARILVRPGTAFRYSNLGYRLLAEVVRRVGGRRWPEYAREALLEPLGMTSTTAFPAGELADRLATSYGTGVLTDRRPPVPALPGGLSEGDGDLWSTVADLARWISQQFRTGADDRRGPQQILDGASLREMQRPVLVASDEWSEARCLGWGAVRRAGMTLVCHGGLLGGFNSHACFSPGDRLGVVALANAMPRTSVGDLAWALAERAAPVLRSQSRSSLPGPPAAAPAEALPYLGRYLDVEDGDEALIAYRGGALTLATPDGTYAAPLVPSDDAELTFRLVVDGAPDKLVVFWREPDGRIGGVNIGGYPLSRLEVRGT